MIATFFDALYYVSNEDKLQNINVRLHTIAIK